MTLRILISMDFDSVRKHGLHVSSTFNTRLAYSCVQFFKMVPRSHANFETTLNYHTNSMPQFPYLVSE